MRNIFAAVVESISSYMLNEERARCMCECGIEYILYCKPIEWFCDAIEMYIWALEYVRNVTNQFWLYWKMRRIIFSISRIKNKFNERYLESSTEEIIRNVKYILSSYTLNISNWQHNKKRHILSNTCVFYYLFPPSKRFTPHCPPSSFSQKPNQYIFRPFCTDRA